MPNISDYFDSSKEYKELKLKPGSLALEDDWNWIQDISNYDKREMAKYFQGFQLKINDITNSPVLKVKANYDLTEGQVITIRMIDATHAQWAKNSGAWSASIVVTCDDVTYNTLGTSGLDVVFSSSAIAAWRAEVWVAQGMRLLGGELDYLGAAGQFRLHEGKWNILGEFEDFTSVKTVVGASANDYIYLKVETNAVTYSTDVHLGHRLADANYDPQSPDAYNRVYTLMSSANFPDNTSSPYVQYFIVGKVDTTTTDPIVMWDEPNDIQKIMRIYGDTNPPSVPTGLTLTTGSDSNLATSTTKRAKSQVPTVGYLEAVCDANNETDTDYYEFKFVVLATPGGAITSDTTTYRVSANTDAGGAGIPLGIKYTLHGQLFGIPYGVFVRAVDYAGNVSNWSARVDEVIGGSTSGIGAAVIGPTFSLTDSSGFVGVEVSITALPAGAEGFSIWVNEGSYPTVSVGTEYASYNKNIGIVKVPWKESGKPYFRLKAFDENGIYQALYSEDNISLESSAQLSTETHNQSLVSHGGLLTGIAEIESRYGTFSKWAAIVESQGFLIDKVYVVSSMGGYYSSVASALAAIDSDSVDEAVIFVTPGEYDSGSTLTVPNYGIPVQILGCGANTTRIKADWILNDVDMRVPPGSGPTTQNYAGLSFRNISLEGSLSGIKSGVDYGAISFEDCVVVGYPAAAPLIALDAGSAGGVWYFYAFNSTFTMISSANEVLKFTDACDVVMDGCIVRQYAGHGNNAIYFVGPSGSRFMKNNAIEVYMATTGLAIDSDTAATSITMVANSYNTALGGNITKVVGTVDSNTQLTGNFLF